MLLPSTLQDSRTDDAGMNAQPSAGREAANHKGSRSLRRSWRIHIQALSSSLCWRRVSCMMATNALGSVVISCIGGDTPRAG